MIIYDKKKFFMSTIKPIINPNIMRIEFIFDQVPSNFSVTPADLKYDKDFAYSLTMDDGYVDAYQNVFSMFYGNIPDLTGKTWSGYTYTDGCGNEVMYNASFGGNLVDETGVDVHDEVQNAYIKWSQFEFGTDFGFDIYFHGWGQPDIYTSSESAYTYETYLSAVTLSSNKYYEKIGKRHLVGTRPNGVDSYVDIDNKCPLFDGGIKSFGVDGPSITVAGTGRTVDIIGFRVDNITNEIFNNGIIFNRPQMDSIYGTGTTADNIITAANDIYKRWVTNFTHHIRYSSPAAGSLTVYDFENLMNFIDGTYGKNGLDNIWVCGIQEMIEYLHCKLNSTITTSFEGRKAIVQVEYPTGVTYLTNIRRPSLTLKFNCNNAPTQVNTYNIVKFSNNITGQTSGIINLEWSDEFEIVADKYVTIAESSRLQKDIDFAQYLINRIDDYSIRNPLQTRLNNIIVIITKTYLIDFGQRGFYEQSTVTDTGSTFYNMVWNNITGSTTLTWSSLTPTIGINSTTSLLKDTTGTESTYGFECVSNFYMINTDGVSVDGIYPAKSLRDGLTVTGTTESVFKFTGMDVNRIYDFSFCSSRNNSTHIYNSIYSVTGNTNYGSVSLQASINSTEDVTISSIVPNSSGEIYVGLRTDQTRGYLNVLKIIEN